MGKKSDDPQVHQELTCGLVMPISAMEGCSAEHWVEVKNIICDAVGSIEDLSFATKLVSEQDDVGVIQKRIVQNVYSSDIVICDVSCKNANVMFELGMRLAFDKPTILIKDDKTDFSFDTGVIEHLVYPRDLRFARIVSFKKALADKVAATYQASLSDPNHSTFLKNFGSFKVASVEQTVGTPDQVMMDMIQDLTREVSRLGRRVTVKDQPSATYSTSDSTRHEHILEVAAAISDYKSASPGANRESCLGNESFYDYVAEKTSAASRHKNWGSFTRLVDEVLTNNPHLLM